MMTVGLLIREAAHSSLCCPSGLVSAGSCHAPLYADSLGNSLDVHAGLLLVRIKVDPVAREDDSGVYLGAREAGDRGNAAAGCRPRM